MTVGKGKGVLSHTPISKLDLPETTAARAPMQACEHRATVTERPPDTHRHYARLTCALCGRFLRWLPRPETIERQKLNGFRIAKLTMQEGLTGWEREFVRSVSQQRKLSPRQQAVLDSLVEKFLEANPS